MHRNRKFNKTRTRRYERNPYFRWMVKHIQLCDYREFHIHTGHGVYLIVAEDAGIEKKTYEYCVYVAFRGVDCMTELYGKTVFACLSETNGIL